ncbi:hypothetical protein Dimus_012831 [Dionaea muscipula]
MPLSLADDCLPDLFCTEDDSDAISGDSSGYSSDLDIASVSFEESITELIEEERKRWRCPKRECDLSAQSLSHSLDPSARAQSIAWMLKVRAFYGFQALTVFLSVNYFDRFLFSHSLSQHENGWPLQLLSVACLSLAAKMEEPLVPSLLDLQVEGAKYIFHTNTIQRMELLVLGALDWRLRLITPFSFIGFFAYKLDPRGTHMGFLLARAKVFILSNLQESSFLDHLPSSIAAAAILCAASEIPNLSFVTPEQAESWCDGLNKDKVFQCYRLMQHCVVDRPPKVSPLLTVTTMTSTTSTNTGSMDLFPSSSSSSPPKRRKLNNWSWVDDDTGNSD